MSLLNLSIAFGAGVLSITSPCCLPLLPGYLGYLTGLSAGDEGPRHRPVTAAVLFVGGFTAVFVTLGATASAIGRALLNHRVGISHIAGIFILAMGLTVLLGGRLGVLSRGGDWRRSWARGQLWAAAPLGAAFGITWTPCIGPILGAILTLAASTAQIGQGVALLLAYSLGLGVPFVALSLSIRRVHPWIRRTRRAVALLRTGSAAALVGMGALLVTDRWLPMMAPLLRLYAKAQWPPV